VTDDGLKRARYSKISRRMWGDAKFRALSKPNPNAQSLWQYLLTGPHNARIPGLFLLGELALAELLDWPVKDTRRCLQELLDAEMARFDRATRLFWLPNAVVHNEPESPNALVAWRTAFLEFPECELLREAEVSLAQFFESMGPSWLAAWLAGEARLARMPIATEVRKAVRARDGSFCRYCGVDVNWNDRRGPQGATYDHVNPAGSSSDINVVVCCRSCNSRKGFRTPEAAGLSLIEPRCGSRSEHRSVDRSDLVVDPEPEQEQEQEQEEQQQHAPEAHADNDEAPRPKARRGSRLPENWEPAPGSCADVVKEFGYSDADVRRALVEFVDYWRSIPGQKGCKLDWDATFRNRLRQIGGPAAWRGQRRGFPPSGQLPIQESLVDRLNRENREKEFA
jgi:hypothetical protein